MHPTEKEVITYIIKAMVSYPSDVVVTQTIDEIGAVLVASVNKLDMARVIGAQGQNAKALRQILRVINFKNNSRINLRIVDPA